MKHWLSAWLLVLIPTALLAADLTPAPRAPGAAFTLPVGQVVSLAGSLYQIQLPAGAAKPQLVPLSPVAVAIGDSVTIGGQVYTVTPQLSLLSLPGPVPPPSPAHLSFASGQVTLTGRQFGEGGSFFLDGVLVPTVSWSDTQIVAAALVRPHWVTVRREGDGAWESDGPVPP